MSIVKTALDSPMFEYIVEQLVVLARQILDSVIKGETLSPRTIKFVRTAYNLAKEWADDAVVSTSTMLDDKALNEFFKLAEDTFVEAKQSLVIDFAVPQIPTKKVPADKKVEAKKS